MLCKKKDSQLKVFFLGKSRKAGSWEIRGEQIASSRPHWKASSGNSLIELTKSDVVCFVKHIDESMYRLARKLGKICVYDVIDSWPQPDAYRHCVNRVTATKFFTEKWKNHFWDGVIFPNKMMAQHLGHMTRASAVIYHHFRPGIEINPIRSKVKRLGYEGNETYLGIWSDIIKRICAEKKWEWVVNPPKMSDVDIAIAVREGEHDGFLANSYKSNVKLANMYGSGTPGVLGSSEVSYHETDCGVVPFFSTEAQLRDRLSSLEGYERRLSLQMEFLKLREAYSLEHISNIYESFFISLVGSSGRMKI